jgi:hypothetical protein
VVHNPSKVVADSSFYLVFLKDIDKPQCFKKIADAHDFLMPELVTAEVKRNLVDCEKLENYRYVTRNRRITKWKNRVFSPELLIALLLDNGRKRRGEHEVIAHSILLYGRKELFFLILDDDRAMKLVDNNFSFLSLFAKWTPDFITNCHCDTEILSKEECKAIIDAMESAGSLWITHSRCEELRKTITEC